MEITVAIAFLISPIFLATYAYGGKGTIKSGAIGLALIAAIVVLMFLAAMSGFLEGGIGDDIILAVYAGMVIVAVLPIAYFALRILKKLPHQRE